MAENNNNVKVTVSGITPIKTGDNYFVIDETGTFSLDHSVIAAVYLSGGGEDGERGDWNEDTQIATGGKGGSGGYVASVSNVKIKKNTLCNVTIAEANDRTGTFITIDGTSYRCDQSGCVSGIGGSGSTITYDSSSADGYTDKIEPGNGQNGVSTPFQVLGSGGGGGMSCTGHNDRTGQGSGGTGAGKGGGHRETGTDAVNYGCGGGGGDGCGAAKAGHSGGKGKKGCVVVVYTIEEKNLVVLKHYKKTCTTHKTCDTTYASSSNHSCCCSNSNSGCGCGGGGKSNNCGCDSNTNSSGCSCGSDKNNNLRTKVNQLSNNIKSTDNETAELQAQISRLQAKLDNLKNS